MDGFSRSNRVFLPFYETEDAESAMVKAEKVLSTAIKFVNDWFSG